MEMKDICPCVILDCPNHGNCPKCTSRHLNKGSLNYCAFYAVLPELQAAIAESPDSPAAKRLAAMTGNRLSLYAKVMGKKGLTQEGQDKLLKDVANFSDY